MLFLLFNLGSDRYALDAGRVVEITPLLALKRLPGAPEGVAGLFVYRGQPVPAVDLRALTLGQPARECLSTRIIVVKCPDASGQERLLGLIAEAATELLRRDLREFVSSGLNLPAAPYLGPVLMEPGGIIQLVQEQRLLSDGLRQLLFNAQPEACHDTH
jgi:chemotaxis-related protein WspB